MNIHNYQIEAQYTKANSYYKKSLETSFIVEDDSQFTVLLKQNEKFRTISVGFNCIRESNDAFNIIFQVEKLLQLFEGHFCKLESIIIFGKDEEDTNLIELKKLADTYSVNRVNYFCSRDFTLYSINELVDFEQVLDDSLFIRWKKLLFELDISHQVFLYATSQSSVPIDLYLAFLIELAEPLKELVFKDNKFACSLIYEDNRLSLKKCLDAIITQFGDVIFRNELNNNFDETLQKLVNSRVRIMHIKSKQSQIFISEKKEQIYYSVKLYLLYRVVLFDVLKIGKSLFVDQLTACVNAWEHWMDGKQIMDFSS